jgi:hypothetical protein
VNSDQSKPPGPPDPPTASVWGVGGAGPGIPADEYERLTRELDDAYAAGIAFAQADTERVLEESVRLRRALLACWSVLLTHTPDRKVNPDDPLRRMVDEALVSHAASDEGDADGAA